MQENSSNQKTAKKISDARQQSLNKPDKLTTNDNQQSNLSTKSITQKSSTSTEKKKKKSRRGKSKKNKHLTIHSRTLTLALKFYPEQMMNKQARQSITNPKTGRIDYSLWTDGDLLDQAKAYLNERIKNFSNYFNSFKSPQDKSKRHWEVEAICHDNDEVANPDDMFAPSIVKPHFHVIIRDANNNRFFVETVLKALGLNYQKEDSELFYEHGCTTVADFNAYSVYLTHETEQAKKDGKELYDLSEVMTNMPLDELKDIRAGYQRLQPKAKLSTSDWLKLADEATKLARKMGDFEEWSHETLNFVQRSETKFKHLHELYNKVLNDTIEQAPDLTRCCILISGKANDGKSYTTRHALQAMGETIYNARSGSGKYDGLTSRATAMVFDDRRITDALKVTDNCATVVHGRGTGNDKPWLGHYVVVTTNLTPEEFFKSQVMNGSEVPAIATRFYVSELIYDENRNGRLYATDYGIRGMYDDVSGRHELYEKFADSFNKTIKGYHPLTREEAPKLDPKYMADSTTSTNEVDLNQEVAHLKSVINDLIDDINLVKPDYIFDTHNIVYGTPKYYDLLAFLERGLEKSKKHADNPFIGVDKENGSGKTWDISELLEIVKSGKLPFKNCAYIKMIC